MTTLTMPPLSAKPLYPGILALVEPRLRVGAMVVADDAGGSPEYLARVRSSGAYVSVGFADVEVSMALGV